MSRSTPICLPFCSKCKARSRASGAAHYNRDHVRTWINVRIVGQCGQAALFRCDNCGHEYTSRSRAARRALRRWPMPTREEAGR